MIQMLQLHALQSSTLTCVRPVMWMQSRRTQNLHFSRHYLQLSLDMHAKQFACGEQHHCCAKVHRIYLLPLYCAVVRQDCVCCMWG